MYISNKHAALFPPYPTKRSSHLSEVITRPKEQLSDGPRRTVLLENSVRLIGWLIASDWVVLTSGSGIELVVFGAVMSRRPCRVEHANLSRVYKAQQRLRKRVLFRYIERKTIMRTCLSVGNLA